MNSIPNVTQQRNGGRAPMSILTAGASGYDPADLVESCLMCGRSTDLDYLPIPGKKGETDAYCPSCAEERAIELAEIREMRRFRRWQERYRFTVEDRAPYMTDADRLLTPRRAASLSERFWKCVNAAEDNFGEAMLAYREGWQTIRADRDRARRYLALARAARVMFQEATAPDVFSDPDRRGTATGNIIPAPVMPTVEETPEPQTFPLYYKGRPYYVSEATYDLYCEGEDSADRLYWLLRNEGHRLPAPCAGRALAGVA